LKRDETKKLFYDEYLYKLHIHHPLAHIFRGKNLSYSRNVLDRMQQDFEAGLPIVREQYLRSQIYTPEELQSAQTLLQLFSTAKVDYKLRIDSPNAHIYTNHSEYLELFIKKIKTRVVEYHEPNKSSLDLIKDNKNVIIVNKSIPYKFKVTLGETTDPTFASWSKKNPEKVKLGSLALKEIENNGYTRGMYFYARDEKILQLLSLMIGSSIRRVDTIICKEDLDK
jgi:hypothetical protein